MCLVQPGCLVVQLDSLLVLAQSPDAAGVGFCQQAERPVMWGACQYAYATEECGNMPGLLDVRTEGLVGLRLERVGDRVVQAGEVVLEKLLLRRAVRQGQQLRDQVLG